jgi:hypothetical protein
MAAWRRMLLLFFATMLGAFLAVAAFVMVFDPFGVGPFARRANPVLMDLNQRYMYPQIVRSGRFDSAVIGTSTVRLLNPERLDALLGGRFANLAMNSATAWEQSRIADLFLRHTPEPKSLIVGIDPLWCSPDATSPEQRLTFRRFPETFYDENPWNDWPELLNLTSIEMAWRMALYRLGVMPARYRNDGYEVFTPPENTYDLARAQGHIWGERKDRTITPQSPPANPTPAQRAAWRYPALQWLDALAARMPPGARIIAVVPPTHVANQPQPLSLEAARLAACRAELASIMKRRGGIAVDFGSPSSVTTNDADYWDPLHYRLPVAEKLAAGIAEAWTTRRDAPDGFYRILTGPD